MYTRRGAASAARPGSAAPDGRAPHAPRWRHSTPAAGGRPGSTGAPTSACGSSDSTCAGRKRPCHRVRGAPRRPSSCRQTGARPSRGPRSWGRRRPRARAARAARARRRPGLAPSGSPAPPGTAPRPTGAPGRRAAAHLEPEQRPPGLAAPARVPAHALLVKHRAVHVH